MFFPLVQDRPGEPAPTELHMLIGYAPWLLAAGVAERVALIEAWRAGPKPGAKSLLAFNPAAAYRNVVRMHLLIFFFVGAAILRLEGLPVYAVVYAVYFFSWRVLRGKRPAPAARTDNPAAGGG